VTTRKPRDPNANQSSSATPADDVAPIDFEKALADLESIVEKLEQGDLPLDESLKAFERGVELTRHCQVALKQAEQKVEILLRKTGQPEPFATADDADVNSNDAD
jgi:exodeoxyribonuclease VII small subunit